MTRTDRTFTTITASERDVVVDTESPRFFSLLTVYTRPYIFSLSDYRFAVAYNYYKDRSQGASLMTG